jgi:hypothetical protein
MPTEEERSLGQDLAHAKALGSLAIIRTTLGEITIKLFADECPRTVENFVVCLCKLLVSATQLLMLCNLVWYRRFAEMAITTTSYSIVSSRGS